MPADENCKCDFTAAPFTTITSKRHILSIKGLLDSSTFSRQTCETLVLLVQAAVASLTSLSSEELNYQFKDSRFLSSQMNMNIPTQHLQSCLCSEPPFHKPQIPLGRSAPNVRGEAPWLHLLFIRPSKP